MIDLHAHVLPGIDDGPADLEGSLALLEAAARARTRVIAATPHLRSDYPDVDVRAIGAACAELQARVPPAWNLRIVPAAEVDLVWALDAGDEQLRLASYGQRGRDLLVETPFGFLPGFFDTALTELGRRGYRITLAHPELNPTLQERPERVATLARSGVLLQVTGTSLLTDPARSARARLARRLVADGLAHLLASDAHSAGPWRPPGLGEALAAARRLAPGRAGWMVTAAPAAVLTGKPLPPLPPLPA